jgi:hypothetical protein
LKALLTGLALAWALLWPCAEVSAHPLAPSSLRLIEADDGTVELRFRTPSARPVGTELAPVMPPACAPLGEPRARLLPGAVEQSTRLRCEGGLVGRRFAVRGLLEARTDVLWEVVLADGSSARGLLHDVSDSFEVPARQSATEVLVAFLGLGVSHLLSGLDHVLFVLSLLFVLDRRRALLLAITSFTVGHSLSLALSVLEVVHIPERPVEIAIAATLLVMALEILERHRTGEDSGFARRPGLLAGFFGLVHGLGFAGALADAGLPSGSVPVALFGFNVGLELGQLAVVASALALAALGRRLLGDRVLPLRMPAAYVVGSLSAMWILERALALIG